MSTLTHTHTHTHTHAHMHAHTHNTHRQLLEKVSKVTTSDLQRVGKQYFRLLLEPTSTTTAVCCNPSKVAEVKAGLEE